MGMLIPGLLGALVAFLILRGGGSVLRHVIAIIACLAVLFIAGVISYSITYPYGLPGRVRTEGVNIYVVAGLIAAVLAPAVDAIAAMMVRKSKA
jgi:hypothetical protein